MKYSSDALALRVKGFWAANNHIHSGSLPSNDISEKWIIFASGMPVISEYFDFSDGLSQMLTADGKVKAARYNNDQIAYKRRILHALEIYDELESDDDIALWEVNTDDKDRQHQPGALITIANEYFDKEQSNYGLSEGAFVKALADDSGLKKGTCFAIQELLETRSVFIDDNNKYILLYKKSDEKIIRKTGKIGE